MPRTRVAQGSTPTVTWAGTALAAAVVVIGLVGILFGVPAASGLSIWVWMGAIYALNSLIAFFVYGFDKQAAIKRQYRIPEKTLHLIEFLGGWPGALVAQQVFRHKNRKIEFLIWTGLIVVGHGAFWMSLR